MSKIEWTQETWNPVLGCSMVSKGCENCYAIRMAWRLGHNPKMEGRYEGLTKKTEGGRLNWTGKLVSHEPTLLAPLKVRKPTMYFVNSMSDLFHRGIPMEEVARVFAVMALTPQHTYQVLTKRPEWMEPMLGSETFWEMVHRQVHKIDKEVFDVPEFLLDHIGITYGKLPLKNVWLGVSVEDQKSADERIPHLLKTPAAVRFLSCEPLLGAVDLSKLIPSTSTKYKCSLCGNHAEVYQLHCRSCEKEGGYCGSFPNIDWVIVGGESGPGARAVHPDWVRGLRDQCVGAGVKFFFKQWGEWMPVSAEAQLYSEIDICGVMLKGDPGKFFKTFGSITENDIEQRFIKIGKKKSGRLLDGVEWNEMPVLRQAQDDINNKKEVTNE